MNRDKLPAKVKQEVVFRAFGRCERCHQLLTEDPLTLLKTTQDVFAHIIAASSDGPRGDIFLSPQLAVDPDNIMLMCAVCHKTIDDHPELYTVEKLRRMKTTREDTIRHAVDMCGHQKAHVCVYTAKIGSNTPGVARKEITEAILDEWFPAERDFIELNCCQSHMVDNNPDYWKNEIDKLNYYYTLRLLPRLEKGEIQQLLLFAIAPQPMLIKLGVMLSDIPNVITFQKHREPNSWGFESSPEQFEFEIIPPEVNGSTIALNLSLSATISSDRINRVLGDDVAIWTVTHENPSNDFLRSKDQLAALRTTYRDVIKRICERHGQGCEIHVFPACPVSAAIELGRIRMPKADPTMVIYDQNKTTNSFVKAIIITG